MAECAAVCEHLHLPLQSGSDRVLAAMHRGYTAERYLERLAAARAAIADLAVTTDIIVGFPGETDADFDATLEVAAEAALRRRLHLRLLAPARHRGGRADRPVRRRRVVAERIRPPARRGRAHPRRRATRPASAAPRRSLVEGPAAQDPAVLTGRTRQNRLVHFPPPSRAAARHLRRRSWSPARPPPPPSASWWRCSATPTPPHPHPGQRRVNGPAPTTAADLVARSGLDATGADAPGGDAVAATDAEYRYDPERTVGLLADALARLHARDRSADGTVPVLDPGCLVARAERALDAGLAPCPTDWTTPTPTWHPSAWSPSSGPGRPAAERSRHAGPHPRCAHAGAPAVPRRAAVGFVGLGRRRRRRPLPRPGRGRPQRGHRPGPDAGADALRALRHRRPDPVRLDWYALADQLERLAGRTA